MPRQWTVQCAYNAHWANTVTVEAESLDEALSKALGDVNTDMDGWKSTDHVSETYVDAVAEGADSDPWGPTAVSVPAEYTERGPLPVVTIHDAGTPQETTEVTRGQVLFRFKTPHGDITARRPAPPPTPDARPTVIIRRRPDGAPDVEVTNGDARIRIIDY